MKVALIAESMLDYAVAFAGAVGRHCDATLLASGRHLSHFDTAALPLHVRALDWPRLRSPRNPAFLAGLVRDLRAIEPDLIHVVSQTLTWPAFLLPFRGRLPVVETVHDVSAHPGDAQTARVPGLVTRFLRAEADALVVHTEMLRNEAAKRFAMPLDRIFTLPHLALTRYADLAPQRPVDPDVFDLLFFGRIYLYKGLEYLIAAAERIASRIPHLRVTIAGQGDDLARCRRLITKPQLFDIRDRFIPDAEVAELFARTNAVVLPYIEASQSGVTAIATAFGKPVIGTDVGDFRAAIVDEGPFGLIVTPRNPDALADAIMQLYADAVLQARFGETARQVSAGPRSAATVGALAVRIYERILAAPTRVPAAHRATA